MIEVNRLSNEEVARLTLAWVNDQREKHGMKPLKKLRPGRTSDSHSCVIARSLRNGAVNFTRTTGSATIIYKANGTTETIHHTPVAKEFIHRFDSRKYSDLIYRDPTR